MSGFYDRDLWDLRDTSAVSGDGTVSTDLCFASDSSVIKWDCASPDVGLKRNAAGILQVTDGSTGSGSLIVADGTAAAPGIRVASEASGMYRANATTLGFSVAGTGGFTVNTSGSLAASLLFTASTGYLSIGSRSKLYSPADGQFLFERAALGQGVLFDYSSIDGWLLLRDESGGNLTLSLNAVNTGALYGGSSGLVAYTPNSATTTATGPISVYSGNQTNAGDYDSGAVSIYTGATTTDGDTGNVEIYTGAAGAGVADAGVIKFATNGAPGTVSTMTLKCNTEVLTFSGGTSATTSGLIPDGAVLKAICSRVLTAESGGGATSIDIGDGSDVDLYANNAAITLGATTTNADATASFANPQLAASEVTVTGVGGDTTLDTLSIRIEAWYETFAASTSA